MRLHPEDQTKSGLAPVVVINPRQRLATAEHFGRRHLDIVAIGEVPGYRLMVHLDVVQGPSTPRAAFRAGGVRHPGGILSAVG